MTAEKGTNPVAGLLHVKVPSLGRKRGLPTWKVWKDFWVTAKLTKCSSNGSQGLQLNLSPIKFMHSSEPDTRTTKIIIPGGSTVRRTSSRSTSYVFAVFPTNSSVALIYLAGRSESESQRWIYDFTKFLDPYYIKESDPSQFEVTTLPGALSSAVGISGVMGRLGIRNSGIALREPSRATDQQGRLLGAWGWRQIDHARCRLAAAALPEDDGKLCVIRTTSLFPGGAGDLTVFCSKGKQLVRSLQSKTANILASLSIGGYQRARRMSRSEGDLRMVFAEVARNYTEKEETILAASLPQKHRKLASSLMSVGMRLALPAGRTRSHSENNPEDCEPTSPTSFPDSSSSYAETPPQNSFEEEEDNSLLEEMGSNENLSEQYASEQRRVSNVSVASGVYETIDDGSDDENPLPLVRPAIPPPLPPREYKQFERRRHRGGLHTFFKIQRLWRSNSDSQVAKEEDEDSELSETIYSEVMDPPESPNNDQYIPVAIKINALESHHLSSSCSNLSRHSILTEYSNIQDLDKNISKSSICVLSPIENINNNLKLDNNMNTPLKSIFLSPSWNVSNVPTEDDDKEETESIYLPMNVSRTYDRRHRFSSESRVSCSSNIMDSLSNCSTATSDDSIYVTMNSDRNS